MPAYPQDALEASWDTKSFVVCLILQMHNSQDQGQIQTQVKSQKYFSLF